MNITIDNWTLTPEQSAIFKLSVSILETRLTLTDTDDMTGEEFMQHTVSLETCREILGIIYGSMAA